MNEDKTYSRNSLKAVSLFSGAGGMDVGVLQAGFDVLACIEIDKNCCDTLHANIEKSSRNTIVYNADIRDFQPETLLSDLSIDKGDIDLLFGGPPCQAFSQIGKQLALADERGPLIYQMLRFAKVLRPRAIMMEEVKGLLSARDSSGKPGGVFESFLKEMEDLGYVPKWRVMLAADFGVAQLRERVFIVATRKPNGFQFPAPTNDSPENSNSLFGLPPYVTVGDVISDLKSPIVKGKDTAIPEDSHYDVTPKRDKERIHGVKEGQPLASQTHLPKEQICGLTKKDTTKFLRLSRFKPSNTLRGGEIFFHPIEDRYLTPREYMRIHGYPDSYVLKGPIRGRSGTVTNLDQHRQIGNSVPPPLAKAVAEKIKEIILCQKSSNF